MAASLKRIIQPLFKGRYQRLFWSFWLMLGIALGLLYIFAVYIYYPAPIHAPRSEKRVLEWGWKTPRLQVINAYLDIAQTLPFDGLIIDIDTPQHDRGLSWTLFGSEQVDQEFLDELAAEFAETNWGKLTDNFLRVNIAPADVDWFDDFDSVLYNMEAIARLALQLGFKGIVLDTEQYGTMRMFDYREQSQNGQYTYDAYAQQVQKRAQEVMEAFNRGYAGLTILYTYGMTLGSQPRAPRNLAEHHYGLLMPFIEGMISAADEQTKLVDAFEDAYIYKDEMQFLLAYKLIKGLTRDYYAKNSAEYGQHVEAGFGLWLDHNACGEPGLTPVNCPTGFTPATFENAVTQAIRYSDRYVWIYSQGVDWYTPEGIPSDCKAALLSFSQ